MIKYVPAMNKLLINTFNGAGKYKYFLNQTTLNLRKEKRTFLNREFTVFNARSLNQSIVVLMDQNIANKDIF